MNDNQKRNRCNYVINRQRHSRGLGGDFWRCPPLLMAAYADIEVWVGEEMRVHHVDGSCSELINTVMSKRLLAARPGGAYKLTDNEFEWLRSNYSAFWDYIALVDETKGGKE